MYLVVLICIFFLGKHGQLFKCFLAMYVTSSVKCLISFAHFSIGLLGVFLFNLKEFFIYSNNNIACYMCCEYLLSVCDLSFHF